MRQTPSSKTQEALLNASGQALIAAHVAKPVAQRWPYAAGVGIETVCRTFAANPAGSEAALCSLLEPKRLLQFPHDDLSQLADNIGRLPPEAGTVVTRLFEAAFAAEPAPGSWEHFGGRILAMRIQSSDQWNQIHYALANYFEAQDGTNAPVLTDAVCIAWNATVRRREARRKSLRTKPLHVLSTFSFRGKLIPLIQDYSYIWGRDFEPEESRILSHFEKLLEKWAGEGEIPRLEAVVERFVDRNRTSLMWNIFMEAGSRHPQTLGALLVEAFDEPAFLTNPDYSYAAVALLKSLHRMGDVDLRIRLERTILDLPKKIKLPRGKRRIPVREVIERSQNKALASLEEQDISLPEVLALFRKRQAEHALVPNAPPRNPRITKHTYTDEELVEHRGIDLKVNPNKEMFFLREALKPLLPNDKGSFSQQAVEKDWSVVSRCEHAVRKYGRSYPDMAQELWGYLVGACSKTAHYADWPKTSARWKTFRRILLKAATDPIPSPSEEPESCSAWGWPAPRIDAAQGLVLIDARLGRSDTLISKALRSLSRDPVATVRFNLVTGLPRLYIPARRLMWEIIDIVASNEKNFAVLDALLHSMDWLWESAPEEVMNYVTKIATEAALNAQPEDHIHETLAQVHLFQYFRTGRPECQVYIRNLVATCQGERENKALLAQLHGCRAGGWMTAGDPLKPEAAAEKVRERTWRFLTDLLDSAQTKLEQQRDKWRQLYESGKTETKRGKAVRAELDKLAHLVDGICTQLYFASGAFYDKRDNNHERLTSAETARFWKEAKPLLEKLANEPHPHTAYELVQTLRHLLPCDPEVAFSLSAASIQTSSAAGFQHESMAANEVVKLVEQALADHREIFQTRNGSQSRCLTALLDVLDLFVEAGWHEARRLTHRLEEIYR
jgi:hypothetical protein